MDPSSILLGLASGMLFKIRLLDYTVKVLIQASLEISILITVSGFLCTLKFKNYCHKEIIFLGLYNIYKIHLEFSLVLLT